MCWNYVTLFFSFQEKLLHWKMLGRLVSEVKLQTSYINEIMPQTCALFASIFFISQYISSLLILIEVRECSVSWLKFVRVLVLCIGVEWDTKFELRLHWSYSFGNLMRGSTLRLRVCYFIYFKFTPVFF